MRSLDMANLLPKAAISKRNIGILVVDQAPIKIRIFINFTPFFIKTAATGKAPYRGPAAAEPIKIANNTPLSPDPSPMYFIMVSLGTQTSSRPRRRKIGGMTNSISFTEFPVMRSAFIPNCWLTMVNIIIATRTMRNTRYLFSNFFIYITTIPIIAATRKEKKNANTFLRIEIFLPKYLISTGIVIIPTIISVDTKAAICM